MNEPYKIKRDEIIYIFKKGNILEKKFLTFFWIINKKEISRLIIITKKECGNAVNRNLVRRRIKEIYRKYIDDLNIRIDLIILVKKNISKIKFKIIEKEINKTINQIQRKQIL